MLYPLHQATDGYLEFPNIIGNFLFLGHTQIHHHSQLHLLLESLIIAKAVFHNDLKLTDHMTRPCPHWVLCGKET